MYTKERLFFLKNGEIVVNGGGHELKGHTPGAAAICNLLNVKKNLPIPSLFLKFFDFL